jgi:hypothetical protein
VAGITLRAFDDVLQAEWLPKAMTVHGHRCLFLDEVSAGTGGPDFRLDKAQLDWAERELDAAEAAGQGAAIFMHTYPADLRDGALRLGRLLDRPQVMCVDMGHTHYNELANDGRTIVMATRSADLNAGDLPCRTSAPPGSTRSSSPPARCKPGGHRRMARCARHWKIRG